MSRFSGIEARTTAAVLASSLVAGIGAGALSGESSASAAETVSQAQLNHELGIELSPAMLEGANLAIQFAQADHGAPRKDKVTYRKSPHGYPAHGHDYEIEINTKRGGRLYTVNEIMDQPGSKATLANLEDVQVFYTQNFAGGAYTDVTDAIYDWNAKNNWFAGRIYDHKSASGKKTHESPTTVSEHPTIDPATHLPEYTQAEAAQKLKNGVLVAKNMKKLLGLALNGEQ